jgi:antitoxin PrlF
MRVTTKGQVTIPGRVREILGIVPETDIDFLEDNGRFYMVKTSKNKSTKKSAGYLVSLQPGCQLMK